MSKVWNDSHEPAAAVASVEKSLRDLRLDHLDAVFVHWPFPNHHAPHADVADRDPHARPYDHDAYLALWQALEGSSTAASCATWAPPTRPSRS